MGRGQQRRGGQKHGDGETAVKPRRDIDGRLIRQVDLLVRDARYPSRSQAIEEAVAEHLERVKRRRLAEACARLDPTEEVALAEEGLSTDTATWPQY